MSSNIVKRWKKKTWINADILFEDEFYARTPDTDKSFPPSVNATYTVIAQNTTRSTLEEIPIEDKKDEETVKENTTLDQSKSTQI
jgi:hypothetical protein